MISGKKAKPLPKITIDINSIDFDSTPPWERKKGYKWETKKKPYNLQVSSVISSDAAYLDEDVAAVFQELVKHAGKSGSKVYLNFSRLTLTTPQFITELISQYIVHYDWFAYRTRIRIKGTDDMTKHYQRIVEEFFYKQDMDKKAADLRKWRAKQKRTKEVKKAIAKRQYENNKEAWNLYYKLRRKGEAKTFGEVKAEIARQKEKETV